MLALSEREQAPGLLANCIVPGKHSWEDDPPAKCKPEIPIPAQRSEVINWLFPALFGDALRIEDVANTMHGAEGAEIQPVALVEVAHFHDVLVK